MIKSYKKIIASFLIFGILTTIISTSCFARDNYAYAAGIQHNIDNLIPYVDDFDAYDDCANALGYYQNAGYNVAGHINPGRDLLWSNLYATVQFFAGHGNVDYIHFTETGIYNGNDWNNVSASAGGDTFTIDFIGTNSVHWDADTILVTYSSCNGGGTDGNVADDSVARSTCVRGSDVVVAFTDTVHTHYMDDWTDRYNEKLGAGYGVYDAVQYANSFNYILGGQKNNVIWSHGDSNIKIGTYGNSSKNAIGIGEQLLNLRNIQNNLSDNIVLNSDLEISKLKIEKDLNNRTVFNNINSNIIATEKNIESKLKEIYNNFDINNYQVDTYTTTVMNVNDNSVMDELKYYDYKLKIGDYITDAAYTVVVENNKIKEIYDNNIDIVKQEELLKSNEFVANINDYNVQMFDTKTKQMIEQKYDSQLRTIDKDYTFYYDIKNDKKYVIVSHTTEDNINVLESGIAIDSCCFEI